MPFCFDKEDAVYSGEYYNELLALAYLKNLRDHVTESGFSSLSAWDGRHRSGKSLGATTFGYLLDPTFWPNYEKRLVNEPKEFMEAIYQIADRVKFKKDGGKILNSYKGCCIQIDEGGLVAGAQDWYTQFSKVLLKTFQMFGYLSPVVFFCQPVRNLIDSRMRKMFHCYYRVERFGNQYSSIHPYTMKWSTLKDDWMHKSPVINFVDERVVLKEIKLRNIPDFIYDRYQEIANIKKPELISRFTEEIRVGDLKKSKESLDIDKLVQTVVANYHLYETPTSKPDKIMLMDTKIRFTFKITSKDAGYIRDEAIKILRERRKIELEQRESQALEKLRTSQQQPRREFQLRPQPTVHV